MGKITSFALGIIGLLLLCTLCFAVGKPPSQDVSKTATISTILFPGVTAQVIVPAIAENSNLVLSAVANELPAIIAVSAKVTSKLTLLTSDKAEYRQDVYNKLYNCNQSHVSFNTKIAPEAPRIQNLKNYYNI